MSLSTGPNSQKFDFDLVGLRNLYQQNQLRGQQPVTGVGSGIPLHVLSARASVSPASSGTTSVISVVYSRNPNDKNFQRAHIYIKGYNGTQAPVLIVSSSDSPATFILNNTGESISVIVQAVGNGGAANLATAPTTGVKLPKSSLAGFGYGTSLSAANLDQLPDGTTYGRTNQTALTTNNVDPSKSGVLAKGSIPQTFSNGFTYTSTTTSITISWVAQAVYRVDGTKTTITDGSQAITGLLPNMAYFFYPYLRESDQTLQWVATADVTFPNVVGVKFTAASSQEVTTTTSFALPTNFTLEAWFKTTDTAANNEAFIGKGTPQTGGPFTAHQTQIWINAGIVHGYHIDTSGGSHDISGVQSYNDGQWHHVVYVVKGGVSHTLYIDSNQAATGTLTLSARTTSDWIRMARSNTNVFLTGTVTRCAYYGAALSALQINNHFNAGNTISFTEYDSVVAADGATYYWKLIETSGTSAADSIGTNTGTYVASPTLNQSSAIFAADGSPAIAWSDATGLFPVQAQCQQGRVPMSNGGLPFNTPSTGTGGGGQGGSGSGSGGGHTCFSPDTKIKTSRGPVAIADVRIYDFVLTARGTWKRVVAITAIPFSGEALRMPCGGLVTKDHLFRDGAHWVTAEGLGLFTPVPYDGTIHNLHVETTPDDDAGSLDTEHSFTLASGLTAHNVQTIFLFCIGFLSLVSHFIHAV